ncbi:hypothetical protein [Hymenobacter sp. GOD-10R]|uniref:hypothetical protein n=1 Tax=Hymenobacter sp. GOD-10R TaxID=3093922 RepID=UPI002D78CA1C|nr:hypothetical protein [Hymenobacter sp. GOD-10R]WRQ27657.1 hypothetical protein SD425_21535 [Hymenobacter sp. GOD-10R]
MKIKSLLVSATLLLTLGACQKDAKEEAQPEYADWYALRAPDARAIEAVTGDIDGTLVITTRYKVYQTTDRGRTWRTCNYQEIHGVFGFSQQQDTLLLLTSGLGSAFSNSATAYAASPSHFSLDKGLTWKPYRNWRWRADFEPRVALNRVTTASGTEYSINVQEVPASPPSNGIYLETVGINTSTGQKLTLPNEHQINSLYVDAKSRLYVAASAPLCGNGQNFAFCGEQNGVLYVSKKPQL